MAIGNEYSVDQEIDSFFNQTTVTRAECNKFARGLGGDVVPVAVQGVCSYTVYAGLNAELVAQFRLKSLQLNMEMMNLARRIYGDFAPQVSFRGEIGEEGTEGKEPLYIYVMDRIRGISYLDFILAHNSHVLENSPEFSSWRKNLVTDAARFFALSWKAPQDVDQIYRRKLHNQYKKDLELLLISLPERFRPLIKDILKSLPEILSLPMVLLHKDFGACNIIVDEASCNIVGVVDWAEAEIAPFGLNHYSHQRLISKIHLKTGWSRYDDYAMLEDTFWSTLS